MPFSVRIVSKISLEGFSIPFSAPTFNEFVVRAPQNANEILETLRTENGIEYGDTVDKMDFGYLAKVTALNVATATALSSAPPAPASAILGGAVSSDTQVKWTPVTGATGYRVYWRKADQPGWQEKIDVAGADAAPLVGTSAWPLCCTPLACLERCAIPGRRGPGAEPTGSPRSAHHTSA